MTAHLADQSHKCGIAVLTASCKHDILLVQVKDMRFYYHVVALPLLWLCIGYLALQTSFILIWTQDWYIHSLLAFYFGCLACLVGIGVQIYNLWRTWQAYRGEGLLCTQCRKPASLTKK